MHLRAKPTPRSDFPDWFASPRRQVEDYDLDRAGVQAPRGVQLTATNLPRGLAISSGPRTSSARTTPGQDRHLDGPLPIPIRFEACIVCFPFSGGHGAGAIPVPIPNTEVKTRRGDGTASLGGGRVARRQIFSSGASQADIPPILRLGKLPFFVPRRHRRNTDAEAEGRGGRGEVNLEICANFQDSRAVSKMTQPYTAGLDRRAGRSGRWGFRPHYQT